MKVSQHFAFVEPKESVADVESRLGKVWISSFTWLKNEERKNSAHVRLLGDLCHQDVLIQTMSFNWFELVLWALEERWLNDSG